MMAKNGLMLLCLGVLKNGRFAVLHVYCVELFVLWLKDYCHTIVLQAQFATGGHFVWDITIKYFYNPSYNKAILFESSVIFLDSYYY